MTTQFDVQNVFEDIYGTSQIGVLAGQAQGDLGVTNPEVMTRHNLAGEIGYNVSLGGSDVSAPTAGVRPKNDIEIS